MIPLTKNLNILVPKLIGGNVLINPPIKTSNNFGFQIDRRKCSDESFNQKFAYILCPKSLSGCIQHLDMM